MQEDIRQRAARMLQGFRLRRCPASQVERELRSLMNVPTIRRNVDVFFLYSSNYKEIQKMVQAYDAVMYDVKEGKELLGAILGFRSGGALSFHAFLRIYPNLDGWSLAWRTIPKAVCFFARKKIFIKEIIGLIPAWNHVACRLCLKLEMEEGNRRVVRNIEGDEVECRQFVLQVPDTWHHPYATGIQLLCSQ